MKRCLILFAVLAFLLTGCMNIKPISEEEKAPLLHRRVELKRDMRIKDRSGILDFFSTFMILTPYGGIDVARKGEKFEIIDVVEAGVIPTVWENGYDVYLLLKSLKTKKELYVFSASIINIKEHGAEFYEFSISQDDNPYFKEIPRED